MAGTETRVILWPRDSQDVLDTRELKLPILSPQPTRQAGATPASARDLLDKCGQTFRAYRNTLLLLASVRQQIKRYPAYRAITDDKALLSQLSEENRKGLESKLKDVADGIAHRLISAYRHPAREVPAPAPAGKQSGLAGGDCARGTR